MKKGFCCPIGDDAVHNMCNTQANHAKVSAEMAGTLCKILTTTGAIVIGHWELTLGQNLVCQ
jgi:hypothetical protein